MAAANLLSQALKSSIPTTNTPTAEWDYIGAMLSSFEPKNIQEAMLAVQMVGVHHQTTELLSKAAKYENIVIKEQYLKLALKMSRLFATQLGNPEENQIQGGTADDCGACPCSQWRPGNRGPDSIRQGLRGYGLK